MTDSSIIHQHMYLGRGRLHLRCLSVGRCNLPCQERAPSVYTLAFHSDCTVRTTHVLARTKPNKTPARPENVIKCGARSHNALSISARLEILHFKDRLDGKLSSLSCMRYDHESGLPGST